MKAVQLTGFEGISSLMLVDTDRPLPKANEVLLEVKAAGINFAELEMTKGRYPAPTAPPFVMGFEASGIVANTGSNVTNLRAGDKVTGVVSSGGYAEYATGDAASMIPIPEGLSFAEAATIPIQGLSAYAILKLAAKPQPAETLLIQAAAGGVGLYLVQLAKIMGAKRVIALAGSEKKIELLSGIGADVAINYADPGWTEQVRNATGGKGVDIVLEAASGEIGAESLKLLAPFGRIVMYGSRNIHDSLPSETMRQIIVNNQSLIGFNIPTLKPEQIAECVPPLLSLIAAGRVRLFAGNAYRLSDVREAFEALSNRETIGKVVLVP